MARTKPIHGPPPRKPPPLPDKLDPWERQPWESEKAYEAFFKHYLLQDKPRRLSTAYVAFASQYGLAMRRNKLGYVQPPDNFKRWSYGVDRYNERPAGSVYEGAQTWAERAAVYDKMVNQELEDHWRARQQAIRQEEWEYGDELVKRARKMLDRFDVDATEWTDDTIARHIEIGSKLKRRAAGLPERVESVSQWRAEIKKLGINPDEALEFFAILLAKGADGESDADADSQTG